MFERFTDRARRVLVLAQEEARLLNHNFIGTEHILLGLIHEGDGVAARALESLDIRLEAVRDKIEALIGPPGTATTGSPPFTPRAKKVLELSLREALQLGHNYIGTEHMLLGLVREGEGVAAQTLVSLGADLALVRQQVVRILSRYPGGGSRDHDSVVAGRAGSAPALASGPRCPSCRAVLEGQVAYRVLTVAPVDPDHDVGPLQMAFVYCQRCGVTIAHTADGPDDAVPGSATPDSPSTASDAPRQGLFAPSEPIRWVESRDPTSGGSGDDQPRPVNRPGFTRSTRESPNDLWDAPPPAEVPSSAAVDVYHRGPMRADGSIRGTVGGSTIDLVLQLPWPDGSATGLLGDEPVSLTWDLQTSDSGFPPRVQGTVGKRRVILEGVFRFRPDYMNGIPAGRSFIGGSVQGILLGADLDATIATEPSDPVPGHNHTIVATGSLGHDQFEILAKRNGRPPLGDVAAIGHFRGTYNGQTVHLDLTSVAEQFGDTHVAGACPAPPAFTVLLITACLFFA